MSRHGVVGGLRSGALAQGAESPMRGVRTTVMTRRALVVDRRQGGLREASPKHLAKLVKLVEEHGPSFLIRTLESVRGHELDESSCRRIFSTTHKAKGREFDSVVLEDDFTTPPLESSEAMKAWNPEESNLLYVAATRARQALDPTSCTALLDAWQYRAWPS